MGSLLDAEQAGMASRAALKDGYLGLEAHIGELERLLQTARMQEGARLQVELELSVMKTARGGEAAIGRRLEEIDQRLTSPILLPAQREAMRDEHEALKQVREFFVPLHTRMEDIVLVELGGSLDPTLALTYSLEKKSLALFCDGAAQLEASILENEQQLAAGVSTPDLATQLTLETALLEATRGGVTAIEARIAYLENLRQVARLLPEALENILIEEKVLASIAREITAGAG
ncbi:MAG: hypothetical protein ACO3JL_07460 [Myxococcota bacterium]